MIKDSYPKQYMYRRMVQAKIFMDQHFHTTIDLNQVAHEAFFSKFHFIRLFKNTYGKTPHQYLTWIRIEHARLLLQTGMPVSSVCIHVGFNSLSSFTGLFKKITGITPTAYILQQNLTQQGIKQEPLQYIPGCFAQKHGWSKKSNFQETE